VPGRASGIKMVGIVEMGAPISLDGWQSIRIVGASACVIFILQQKIQKMVKCTFWYQLTWVVPVKVQRAVKWLCVLKVKDFSRSQAFTFMYTAKVVISFAVVISWKQC